MRNNLIRTCLLIAISLGAAAVPGVAGSEVKDPSIEEVLRKAGAVVSSFWAEVSSFSCTESISQEKIAKNGKIEYQQDSVFDYLAITRKEDEDLTVEEVRLPLGKRADRAEAPALLSTNGFPTMLMIFHPVHQSNYRFQMDPETTRDGALHIRFEHISGTPSTAAITVQGRIYPLELIGTAVIEPDTGIVTGMSANLIAPMREINVMKFKVEVNYKLQKLSANLARWLPSRSLIEIETGFQHWRNIHHYSQYRRFNVQAIERTSR